MRPSLFPHQVEGVSHIKELRGRALLCDSPGLGKTGQALVAFFDLGAIPFVVFCPASLRFVWRDEIALWSNVPRNVFTMMSASEPIPTGTEIIITSYNFAIKRRGTFESLKPRGVIVDEAHNMKNPEGKTAEVLVPICQRAKYCLLITGDPILNRPKELATLIAAVRRKNLSEFFWKFAHRYCGARKEIISSRPNPAYPKHSSQERLYEEVWNFDGSSNLPELHEKLKPLMIRRRKRDVLKDLPPLRRMRVLVDIPEAAEAFTSVRQAAKAVLADVSLCVDTALQKLKKTAASRIFGAERGRLVQDYHKLGELKIEFAWELLRGAVAPDNPVVGFGHNISGLKFLQKKAEINGISVGLLYGATPHKEREELVKRFQAGEISALLVGLLAGNAGLTLTRAHEAHVYQLPWNPGIANQLEGRIERIGQLRGMVVKYLVASDTPDEILWRLLHTKGRNIGIAIDGDPESKLLDAEDTTEEGDYWRFVRALLEQEKETYGNKI